jgi:hypothetical protein
LEVIVTDSTNIENNGPLLSRAEFQRRNGIGTTLFYRELASGRLKARKIGSRTVITPEAEAAWRAALPDWSGDDKVKFGRGPGRPRKVARLPEARA